MMKSTNRVPDYKPCRNTDLEMICENIPNEEVKQVFNRIFFPKKLISVILILQSNTIGGGDIPENVFGNKQFLEISIMNSIYSWLDRKLNVDANAFQSTKSYTRKFKISIVDCTFLDLDFLSGFEKLANLMFSDIENIQHCLPKIPPLPSLTTLWFERCSGMTEIQWFPTLSNGLKDIRFDTYYSFVFKSQYVLNDQIVDRIMDWLLLSSENTLEDITITNMDQVTQVPQKIRQFKVLRNVWLQNNKISALKSGAFSFSVPVCILDVSGNGVKKIEPGAFQGTQTFTHYIYFIFN